MSEGVRQGGGHQLAHLLKLWGRDDQAIEAGVGFSCQSPQDRQSSRLDGLMLVLGGAAVPADQSSLRDPEPEWRLPLRGRSTDDARIERRKLSDFAERHQLEADDGEPRIVAFRKTIKRPDRLVLPGGMRIVFLDEAVQQLGDVVTPVQPDQIAAAGLKAVQEFGFGEQVQTGR